MISLEAAIRIVLEASAPLGTEQISLDRLHGRVLAAAIVSPRPVPFFENSAVDGFAVRASELESASESDPVALPLDGTVFAGQTSAPLPPGLTRRIMTGAPVPGGADSVVMQEEVEVSSGQAVFRARVHPGAHIRAKGEELSEGQQVIPKGTLVNPPVLSLIASLGIAEAHAFRSPSMAVLGTGDELVSPGSEIDEGQIFESNTFALRASAEALGCPVVAFGRAKDDLDQTTELLAQALDRCDVVITSGGVSVGERDYVRPALSRLEVEELIWRVSLKPGKPFLFGRLGRKLVFGLPGNPVSSLITFQLFVRPSIRRMLGLESEPDETGVLTENITGLGDRYELVRGTMQDRLVTPNRRRPSHMLTGIAPSDCLIHMPVGVTLLDAGSSVKISRLRWGLA